MVEVDCYVVNGDILTGRPKSSVDVNRIPENPTFLIEMTSTTRPSNRQIAVTDHLINFDCIQIGAGVLRVEEDEVLFEDWIKAICRFCRQ